MRVLIQTLSLFLLFSLLTACGSVDVHQYQAKQPKLNLQEFFTGKLTASGIVQDFSGEMVRHFNIEIQGRIEQTNDGELLILDEQFLYDDGEQQTRIWQIKQTKAGHYQGTANDILGIAEGRAAGNALHWQYDMLLPVDGEEYQVHFDDWMYQVNDTTIINRSEIIKFGITVAEVILVIQKQG